jgi:CheY-like chemotaxis protein
VTFPDAAILVVDDNEDNRYTLVRRLEREGYRDLATAADGREALDRLAAGAFDLVLLDVMMPEVDGWEMLRRVQERHGQGAIPVIMFSGQVDEEAASEAASRGAQGFIGKPFNPQDLIEQTKQLLPAT